MNVQQFQDYNEGYNLEKQDLGSPIKRYFNDHCFDIEIMNEIGWELVDGNH